MKHILELNEFFVEGKSQKTSHVLLHITEPSTPEEREKGYFFALAEVIGAKTEQIEHIQQMIDDLESGYYETDDEEEKSAFEITLEYINRRGHHILQYRSELHAIVGSVKDGKISFAYHGQPVAAVWYRNKQGVYNHLSVVDPSEAPAEDQLFSSLLQGEIQKNDFFFVATPHVTEYFSEDRLQKIITTRPARQSASHIQKVLSNLRSDESFGGILFHLATKDQLPKTGKMPSHLKQGSADSLNKLIDAQRHTDETLNPPMLSRAAGAMGNYLRKKKGKPAKPAKAQKHAKKRVKQTTEGEFETNHRSREPVAKKQNLGNMLLIGLGKALVTIGQFLLVVLQRFLQLLQQIGVGIVILITNQGGQRQQLISKARNAFERRKQAFASLPMMSKVLFVATLIFATLFVGSIVFLRAKEAREAKLQSYNNMISAIVDKADAAEASMIYGDDDKAFTLLKEAEELVATLPQKSDEELAKAEELSGLIESGLQDLRKIEVVTPTELSNIGAAHANANTERLVQIGDTLVAYGPDDSSHYVINAQTGSVEQKDHSAIANLAAASTPKEEDFTIFVSGDQDIAELSPDGFNISARTINFPSASTNLSDLFVYNRRVYTLDPANQQIFKHSATGGGYDQGAPWIKQVQADLSDAVSLAIDGDIFVLKANGQVVKFEAGNETSFSVGGLDPALANPTTLWTYNDVDDIYILEPSQKRVVILNKDGVLKKQIMADAWQNPTGMVVDAADGVLYILDSNIVYSVSI